MDHFFGGEPVHYGRPPNRHARASWFLFDPETPNLPNLTRWYEVIRQRPAFLEYIADPAVHLSG